MIVTLFSVWLIAQLPPPACARGETTERDERGGRVMLTCSLKKKKLRRVLSERGVRTSSDLITGVSEDFLESTGQRLSRQTALRFGVAKKEPDQTWWPDGCLLSSNSGEGGELFFEACARKRSEAPDGGTGQRVVVIPPAFASMPAVDRLSTLGLQTERSRDGGVRVCLSDAGPCELTGGQAIVFSGEQALLLSNMSNEAILIDLRRRTRAPAPETYGVMIGGTEFDLLDGGSVDLLTGARQPLGCADAVRRLGDGSLLCWQRSGDSGYRRVWKDRSRFCPAESLGPRLISSPEAYRPSVFLLSPAADAQCLEVFDGLLDWVH